MSRRTPGAPASQAPAREPNGVAVEVPVTIFDDHSRHAGHLRFDDPELHTHAFLRAGLLFEIDEPLRMELSLPGSADALPLVGRVISIHREADGAITPGMSIELTWLADDDLRQLQAYLRQRRA